MKSKDLLRCCSIWKIGGSKISPHENGRAWDESTFDMAAQYGHWHVLTYAQENVCPWNRRTSYEAEVNEHRDTLEWVRQHGCPYIVAEMINHRKRRVDPIIVQR
jgi:hypothetical protein